MKTKKLFLIVLSLLCSLLVFASCGDDAPADNGGQPNDVPSHTHNYSSEVTEPTCTTDGYTTYTCECGYSYVGDVVGASHSYTSHSKVTIAPGCETPGVKELYCVCGAFITEDIEPKGHDYTRSKTISTLTCTQDGVTEKYCDCGYKTTVTVKASGHDYVVETVDATCTEDGIEKTSCSKCTLGKTEKILYAAHNVGDDGVCSVCKKNIWDGSWDVSWYSESETVFTIMTPEQLAGFAVLVNDGNNFYGKTVKLGADIYLGDRDWTAIGTEDKYFEGTFDGQNHTVSGFIYRAIDGKYVGLFGVNYGEIKNVSVAECRARIDSQLYNNGKVNMIYFGAIVASNAGKLDNCSADVDVMIKIKGGLFVHAMVDAAGIVGANQSSGVISNCSASGNIEFNGSYIESLQLNIGGLVAYAYSSSDISSCTSSVDVLFDNLNSTSSNSSSLYMGSFIGYNSGKINSSSATGDVVSKHTVYSSNGYDVYIGGFAGYHGSGVIQNSSATGNVNHSTVESGDNNYVKAAGFVGYASAGVVGCFSTGNVTVNAGKESHSVAGGFAGQIHGTTINGCYCTGSVNNVSLKEAISGGFAGYISNNGILRNSYSTGNVHQETNGPSSGETTYAGGLIGMMVGRVEYCYSTGNVMVICGGNYYAIGASLIGKADSSAVTACFCVGDVYAKGVMKASSYGYNKAGTVVAEYTSTTLDKCYYKKDMDLTTYNAANISFSPSGNALGLGSFMTISFIEKTLGWNADIWNSSDEALPTLSAFN